MAGSSLARAGVVSGNCRELTPTSKLLFKHIVPQCHLLKRALASFQAHQLEIERAPSDRLKSKPDPKTLVFGRSFSDHMLRVDWKEDSGWGVPRIMPFQNISLHPAAKVLHYALEAFEGTKAFRGHDDEIRLFRLDRNIQRLVRSARRLALPEFDVSQFEQCIHTLVSIDRDWVPPSNELMTSLYIRPTIIGTEPTLGVDRSHECTLYVIMSPVGPYYKEGFKPVSLYANPKYVRAWPGGAGDSKLGSNYAPTIAHQKVAESLNLQQVLWLFGDDQKLTEVGCMNVMVCLRDEHTDRIQLVTPPLDDGLILPGIVRDSIIELVRDSWSDIDVVERYIDIAEIRHLVAKNSLVEMFGTGTACVVCPIKSIQIVGGNSISIPTPESSASIAHRILKDITDIQYGRRKHQWARLLQKDATNSSS